MGDGRPTDVLTPRTLLVVYGVDPRLVIGPGTEVIAGEHMIATPGGIDSHIHMIAPQQAWAAVIDFPGRARHSSRIKEAIVVEGGGLAVGKHLQMQIEELKGSLQTFLDERKQPLRAHFL